MKRSLGWAIGLAALALSVAVAGSPHKVFLSDGEKIDLADLKDGESRRFAAGDREITATRDGGVVTLSFGDEPEHEKRITCSIGEDQCYVITSEDGGSAKVMILKSREEGDMHVVDHDVFVVRGDGGGAFAWVDAGDGEEMTVHSTGHGHGDHSLIRVEMAEGTLLRCPEGDATLRLEEGEAAEGYYCPKHKVLMEKVEHPHERMKHEIVIERDENDE